MRLVMDKSRYDTRKGARLVLACKLEASQKRPSSSVKDVVDRANEMKKRGRKLGRRLEAAMEFEGQEAVDI